MSGKNPTVISLFAGCGGSSLGYQMAGFKELLAIDFDAKAVEMFKSNFDIPIWQKDIKEISGETILRFCNLKKGELDILDGSPPCQGFSTLGKRQICDERNDLFLEFIRLIKELEPKIFIMENVSGLVKGKMKGKFKEIMKHLKSLNYEVKCELLNAKYYGVPQDRKRLIWCGIRKDLKIEPSLPKPQVRPISVKEAIDGLNTTESQCTLPKLEDEYAKVWFRLKPGENASKILGKDRGFTSCIKLNPDKPSKTLRSLQTGRGFGTICHWSEPRALTIEEGKRIQSFPDDFKLKGTYQQQWAVIGNSVPPLMLKAIAEHIQNNILIKIGDSNVRN